MTKHVHGWEPTVHNLASLHFLLVGQFVPGSANCSPADAIERSVIPLVLPFALCPDGFAATGFVKAVFHM